MDSPLSSIDSTQKLLSTLETSRFPEISERWSAVGMDSTREGDEGRMELSISTWNQKKTGGILMFWMVVLGGPVVAIGVASDPVAVESILTFVFGGVLMIGIPTYVLFRCLYTYTYKNTKTEEIASSDDTSGVVADPSGAVSMAEQNGEMVTSPSDGLLVGLEQESSPTDVEGRLESQPYQQAASQPLSQSQSQAASASAIPSRPRLYYLDVLKVFLTFMVVTHHVTCAFGACGPTGWFYVVGLLSPSDRSNASSGGSGGIFRYLSSCLVMLNQAYFMSLFFFLSAYFTPDTHRRYGTRGFLRHKCQRLLVPALFLTFALCPFTAWMSLSLAGGAYHYDAFPGHGWYLLWLTFFDMIYHSFVVLANLDGWIDEPSSSSSSSSLSTTRMKFPGVGQRWMVGGIFCGLMMGLVIQFGFSREGVQVVGQHLFMPLTIGSLVNDVVFFSVGLLARRYQWLDVNVDVNVDDNADIDDTVDTNRNVVPPLRERLDWPVNCLWVAVTVEAIDLCVLLWFQENYGSNQLTQWLVPTAFFIIAGIFAVDVSTALLEFFQTHFPSPPSSSLSSSLSFSPKFLLPRMARVAYAVYVIHPIVIVPLTALFVQVYNACLLLVVAEAKSNDSIITFSDQNASYTPLLGPDHGGLVLWMGWASVLVSSQLLVWTLAHFLLRYVPWMNRLL